LRSDAIVVGAGICGLATAYELARRDASVLVIEAVGVGAEQSVGLARIFRVAHRDPRLRELALTAREGWRCWEHELGTHLLGDEGLILVGGMDGFTGEALDADAIRARLPMLAPGVWDTAELDPLAGA
jgi:sarcosine oxidase